MAYIYSFCFYMSLRLGSIIVGIVSLIQGLGQVIIFSIAFGELHKVSKQLKFWNDNINFAFMKPYIESVISDPKNIVLMLLIFSIFYMFFCVLMIYGAYTFRTFMIYPFVIMEFIRVVGLTAIHVIAMMLVKENVINLGLLIGFTVFGGFLLLGVFYMWFCTLNLALVIKELTKEIEITDITNFPQKPVLLPDIYTVRNNYMYNY